MRAPASVDTHITPKTFLHLSQTGVQKFYSLTIKVRTPQPTRAVEYIFNYIRSPTIILATDLGKHNISSRVVARTQRQYGRKALSPPHKGKNSTVCTSS